MDKMKLAHDWAMQYGNKDYPDATAEKAWDYADAMQAEEDSRKASGIPEALIDLDDEWQPDWSKAPENCHYFCVGSSGGDGFFTNIYPEIMDDYFYVGSGGVVVDDHGYVGDWQNSLRKRP